MRKNELPKKATTVLALPECWILEENGICSHLKNAVRDKRLPVIEAQYEDLLEEMGIPHRTIGCTVSDGLCEYWTPDCYEQAEVTLPLYECFEGEYTYAGRFYTDIVYSQKTLEKAEETATKVKKVKKEFYDKIRLEYCLEQVRELIEGKQAVGFFSYEMDCKIAEKISDEHIEVLPVRYANNDLSDYFAVFNLEEISKKEGPDIQMEVPAGKEGLFIGSGKWQVRGWTETEWARQLGIRKIWVVGL